MACGLPSKPTSPLAKSLLCVMIHSDEPSPGTITFLPRRIRSTTVYDLAQLLTASVICVSP